MISVLRVVATISLLMSLCWLLWPASLELVWNEPEPIYVFGCALIAWLVLEGKSFHFEYTSKRQLPEADLEILKRFVVYHRGVLRELLREHDLGASIPYRYFEEIHGINHEVETKVISFHKEDLERNFAAFALKLKKFGEYVAVNSTPDLIGRKFIIKLSYETIDNQPSKSQVGNKMAYEAWKALDFFVTSALKKYPDGRASLPDRKFYHSQYLENSDE